jgi:hypothetical protein
MNDTVGMKTKLTNLPQRRDPLFPQPGESLKKSVAEKHIYLRVGDKVFHKRFRSWGCGIVMEARASDVPGGLCYVRIQFQDGKKRVFDNCLDSSCCCYYAGIALLNRIALE